MNLPPRPRHVKFTGDEISQSQNNISDSEFQTELSEYQTELSDSRTHMANERTHLSYLRTGVSFISLGITLNRFSVYLLQSEKTGTNDSGAVLHDAKNVGIGMVILGSLLLIWSVYHFLRRIKEIETSKFKPAKWSILFFTFAVIVIGVLSTIWLTSGK
ncbi:YidH family protein [Bdellovibrio sp. HCB-110]|uniref:YidH family protein n=1 Tax=Bdellovibrio sp. HCB-110 TaxID=3391182 RepID=UPI0039B60643